MLSYAITLAHQAGELLRQGHARGVDVIATKQSDVDLLTEVDLASEKLICDGLRSRFPGHAILSEESSMALPERGPVWVVDPLDGTTNFAHGYPVFSVTLALVIDQENELGVVYDPLRDETFVAERRQGAWRDGRRMQVSSTAELGRSLLATGFAYDRATNPDNNLAEFCHFMPKTRGVRRAGSAALDLAFVAAGRLEGYWEQGLNIWDTAAGVLMVREAGGSVTVYGGHPWRPGDRSIVASNGVLHETMLSGLGDARQGLPNLD
jgi:myo-inositol-1(or 4)-monophosphatase